MKLNEDGKTVAAMDCLVPGIGEIIGGSQREDNYEKLLARMNELGLKEEDYQFYLDLRKYGSTRHSGFGLGFERCVMYHRRIGSLPVRRIFYITILLQLLFPFMRKRWRFSFYFRRYLHEIHPYRRCPLGHGTGQR